VFIGVRFNLPKRVLAILLSFAAGPSSTHWLSNSYAYKRRNVVERSFNTLKQWRSLATRYDKLALTYRSAAVLQAVFIWSAALGDTP